MKNLFYTEWLKIKNYRAFWWVMGITALTYPGINYIFLRVYREITQEKNEGAAVLKWLMGNPFAFPESWRTVGFFSSIFVFIPAIVIIMLITNEFSFKTCRQNIIDGWSRNQFMKAKLADVIILSGIITVLYAIVAFIIGLVSTDSAIADKWKLSYYVGLFALQSFSQLSIAFMVGLLVRRAFISLAIFVFYFLIAEPIMAGYSRVKLNDIGRFLPLETSDRLLPMPAFMARIDQESYNNALRSVNYHIVYTIILIIITWAFCFWIFNKRDI